MGAAALRNLVGLIVIAVWVLVVARVIVSWVDPRARHPFSRSVVTWSEPVLAPIRRFLPPIGGLDLAPLVLMLALGVLLRVVGV